MIDKIRAHARGELPPEYLEKLGSGFDGRCVRFLGLKYEEVVARVKEGGSDEEIWQWAWERGRKPSEEDMGTWNEFLRNAAGKTRSRQRWSVARKESGLQERADIVTMFPIHRRGTRGANYDRNRGSHFSSCYPDPPQDREGPHIGICVFPLREACIAIVEVPRCAAPARDDKNEDAAPISPARPAGCGGGGGFCR
jgi:gluconokinase